MRRCFFLGLVLSVSACHAAPEPKLGGWKPPPEQPLRLEAVRFYESGISYFERAGSVRSGDGPALFVPEAHLDDALRTLVVLSGTRDRALSLEFESVVSPELARVRAALPPDGSADYFTILESLENQEVEVETDVGLVRGRLTSATPDGEDYKLTIVGPRGAQRLRASEAKRVRPADPKFRALLESALDPRAELGAPRFHPLRVVGTSGPLRLGYVAETPVWEPAYRLIVPAAGAKARLTASAVVHNDTDERWSGVRATFASGRPESSLYALSALAYSERERARGRRELSGVPQLGFEGTPPVPSSKSHGATATSQRVGGASASGRSQTHKVREPGSFEYRAREAIAVRPHGTALVPFLDVGVEALAIVWFPGSGDTGRRTLRLRNSTAQTLPWGSLAAFGPSDFVGECFMPRLQPGEEGYLELTDELDVTVEMPSSKQTDTVENVAYDGTSIVETVSEHYERKYVVTNRKTTPVTVYLGLGVGTARAVRGFDRMDDRDQSSIAGVLELEANQKLERAVVIDAETIQTMDLESVTAEQLRELAVAPALAAGVRRSLTAAAVLADRMALNATAVTKSDERIGDFNSAITDARSDVSAIGDGSGAAEVLLVARLISLEKECAREVQRGNTLRAEGERLTEALRQELARLPKPATAQ